MIKYICDNCKEDYSYEIPLCPGCLNTSFDIDEDTDGIEKDEHLK